MKKSIKPFIVDVDIYDEQILFVLCSRKALKKWLKKFPKKERKALMYMYDEGWSQNPHATAITSYSRQLPLLVSVREMDTDNYTIGNIQHEIFHCTAIILRWKGMELCEESEEAFAYLNGYITSEVHCHINKLIKKCWNKYIKENYIKK